MASRDRPPVEPAQLVLLAGLAVAVVAAGMLWLAVAVGAAVTGGPGPGSVVALPVELLRGGRPWPGPAATAALAGQLVLSAAVGAAARRQWAGRGRGGVDAAARHLADRRQLGPLTEAGARASAVRLLGQAAADPAGNGQLLGVTVRSGTPLYGSWEDTEAAIWGPRTGKTSSRVIPRILDAPGAVLATSNRRDVLDATRLPRSEVGAVWVFDPQAVAGEEPSWWWDPLATVTTVTEARKLAGHFASASRAPGARPDAFFDPAGESLLAHLMLAAAASGEPLLTVYEWLADPLDRAPARALAAAGHRLLARAVIGVLDAPEKLRGSVYVTAQQMAACLVEPAVTRWISPPARPLPQFDVAGFASGTDTLYALSREGEGSAAPLVTALCAAVLEQAERVAAVSARGRLPVPLVAALDEAANVCRIRGLPDLYSHYGGRGIVLITILQSWSQGVEVWGEKGMAKLWSAANVKSYGGGVSEAAFLDMLSRLIGDRDVRTVSTTWSRGTRSVSRGARRDRVLDVAELAALPRGRAVLFASGLPPTLIAPTAWWAGRHAEQVRASLERFDPGQAAEPPGPGDPADTGPAGGGGGSG